MSSRYAGKWIPDTPARREAILKRLRGWSAFSNSSPVEGITSAIRTFAAPDKKVSLYVFGDETTGDSIAARSYLLGGLIIAPVGFISALLGMAAAAQHPGIVPAEALPRVVLGLPPLAAGIILAGLWAADVSTASAPSGHPHGHLLATDGGFRAGHVPRPE